MRSKTKANSQHAAQATVRRVPRAPNNYQTASPYLTVRHADQFIVFLQDAFEGRVSERITRPDGKIAHADVRIGDSTIMLTDATDEWPAMPGAIYLYVHDVDATYQRALTLGAASLMKPADQFHGDRMAGVQDPFGNVWWIVTHIEDVPPEAIQRRADAEWKR